MNSALPLPVSSGLAARTHATSLDELHRHPGTAETATLKEPACGGIREEELASSKRHSAGFWVTVTGLADKMSVADRSIAAGFSATSTLTAV